MSRVASLAIALDRALSRRLTTTGGRATLCAVMAGIFLLAAGVRLFPFLDDVTPERVAGDDWLTIAMPVVAGSYRGPAGGFLYSYFVAAIFAFFGVNSAFVYLTQAAPLGLSIGLMFLVFRLRLPPGAGLVYLGALAAFLSVDAFLKYTVRLLSENLLLVILPLFFWCALRALEGGRLSPPMVPRLIQGRPSARTSVGVSVVRGCGPRGGAGWLGVSGRSRGRRSPSPPRGGPPRVPAQASRGRLGEAGPGRPPAAPAEVAFIVPMRRSPRPCWA